MDPCEICRKRAGKKAVVVKGLPFRACDDCGKPIPRYESMGGSGFESCTGDHDHLVDLGGGRFAKAPAKRELCYECYCLDFVTKYPKETPPVIANVTLIAPLSPPPPTPPVKT